MNDGKRAVDEQRTSGTCGKGGGLGGIERKNPEAVAEAGGAEFEQAEADLQSFFETRGTVVAAGGLEARPAVVPGAGRGGGVRGVAEGAEEGVFGGFDVAEEIREMDDAGEIGVGEFDLAAVGEMERGGRGVGHAGLGGGGREMRTEGAEEKR